MKKILLILTILLAGIIVNAETYYVKNGGNNALAGTSDATAWETIAKVNATSFAPGDSVLFKRGGTWREYTSFAPPAGTSAGRIYYGSYGTGDKPLFLGSKEENEDSDWTNTSGNLWKNDDAQFNYGDGVGNLIFNNEASCGHKELTMGSVNAQGDWFWNDAEKAVYLYSVGNPGTFYTDIECAIDRTVINLGSRDYITLDGLDVRYGGYNGIEGSWGNDNITIRNCHVSFIGGCEFPDVNARVGNGIQFYGTVTNALVENNHVEQIYDDGLTNQRDLSTDTYTIQCDWINNIVDKCRCSTNWFIRSVNSTVKINIYNNTFSNAGQEWSADQRPDSTFGARHIRLAGITGTIDYFNIKNNIFYQADYSCFYSYAPLPAVSIDYNLYYNTEGDIGNIDNTNSYPTLAAWQAATSQEVYGVNGDPLFTSSTDFTLTSGSPAINTGADVGITYDYAANARPQNIYYDIGAYEYTSAPVATTGLGWEPVLSKRNFKDDVNFDKGFSVDNIPIVFNNGSLTILQDQIDEIHSSWDDGRVPNKIKASALGISPIVAMPLSLQDVPLNTQVNLTDNRGVFTLFYIPEPVTITGVRFVLQTAGNYTGDNYNGFKLYSVGTASYTRIDSTANNADVWKATAVTATDVPFVGGERLLQPGLYAVAFVYNQSAQTTAPAMYSTSAYSSVTNVLLFGTGGNYQYKLASYVASCNDLPLTQAYSGLTAEMIGWCIALY